jgi:GNAT superfamily N-acetyltransferase
MPLSPPETPAAARVDPADRLTLLHTLDDRQIDQLVALYQELWWAVGRQRADVVRMLGGCVPFAFVDSAGDLVAFARTVTDGVYKALLCDVAVAARYRGTGLGRRLIDAVLAHPVVGKVTHVELYCLPDLIPFYEQWGFTDDLGEVTFMRCTRP